MSWAMEARSVNEVATFRSANAGTDADNATPSTSTHRISNFIESSKMMASCSHVARWSPPSVRMSRVKTDRVAHLDHDPVVGGVSAGVCLGVAVLQPHERELRRLPCDVGGRSIHVAGDRSAGVVDEKVGEALARSLASNADPPDL